MRISSRRAFTLTELLVIMIILAALVAVLLPLLSSARKSAMVNKMANEQMRQNAGYGLIDSNIQAKAAAPEANRPQMPTQHPPARIKSLEGNISLTSRISVGTAEPESLYEVKFSAKMLVAAPAKTGGDCELSLPLPPVIYSLSDVNVLFNGEPSEAVSLRGDKLVWEGALPGEATRMEVTYTAVGKGVYSLPTPAGGILDKFQIDLVANESGVQMQDLSLQPTKVVREAGKTSYSWNYTRLLFGRPIQIDMLGIAPTDRLSDLRWLGPISVVLLGLIIGLVAGAFQLGNFDRWMLLLVLGTFTGAYPLMYFAQEFIALNVAMGAAGALVLVIVGLRSISIMGFRLALLGVVIPAGLIMALTLAAAIRPAMQGVLLTTEVLGFFVIAMFLMPRVRTIAPPGTRPELQQAEA